MTKMYPSPTQEPRKNKRVRFNDRVKIIEIERVDRTSFTAKEMRDETEDDMIDDNIAIDPCVDKNFCGNLNGL